VFPACRPIVRASLVAAAVALVGGDAAAQPSGRLVTTGDCPSRGQMAAALDGVVDVGPAADWTIAIAREPGGARMTVRNRRGAVALERRLGSRDCRAMASAFAVILHAFFRQLAAPPLVKSRGREEASRPAVRARKARRAPAVREAGEAREPEVREPVTREVLEPVTREPVTREPDVREPEVRQPVTRQPDVREPEAREPGTRQPDVSGDANRIDPRVAQPATREPPVARGASEPASADGAAERVSATAEARGGESATARPRGSAPAAVAGVAPPGAESGRGIELALAGGGTVSERTGASAFGMLEMGWRFGQRLSARMRFAADTPSVQDEMTQRVALQPAALGLGLGYEADAGRLWIRPTFLFGAAVWWVDALDIDEEASHLSVQPLVAVGTAAGLRLGRSLSLRADIGQTVFLRTDRYLTAGDGEVARSPRTALAIGLGLEWATFR
jgi:hypothetical protein